MKKVSYYFFRKETFDSVERSTWESSRLEWETEKRRFLNAIGDTGGSDLSQSFLLRPELSQIHDSTLGTRSALDSLEMVYADQVTNSFSFYIFRCCIDVNLPYMECKLCVC